METAAAAAQPTQAAQARRGGRDRVPLSPAPRPRRAAEDLEPAYPRWADVQAMRERLDPDRVFTNAYLDRVLGG